MRYLSVVPDMFCERIMYRPTFIAKIRFVSLETTQENSLLSNLHLWI